MRVTPPGYLCAHPNRYSRDRQDMIRVSRVVATVSAACGDCSIAGCSTVTVGTRGVPPLRPVPRRRSARRGRTQWHLRRRSRTDRRRPTNTDGGDVDRLTLLAVNDVADFLGTELQPVAGRHVQAHRAPAVVRLRRIRRARRSAAPRPTTSPTRSTAPAARSWRGTAA